MWGSSPPSPWRKESRRERLRRWARREGLPLACLLLMLLVGRSSLANHYHVPTGSMEPTLMPGDRVVVDMRAYGLRVPFTEWLLWRVGQPAAGDVVVFRAEDGVRLIKRVVAVEGDRVDLVDGRLRVNGRPLSQGAEGSERIGGVDVTLDLADGGGPDLHGEVVGKGRVLVLGDHRGASADSRVFGQVEASSIYGRARGVFWRRGDGFGWRPL